MFGTEEMLFTLLLITITAIGTYIIARDKYLRIGISAGSEATIDSLIEEGYLEITLDKDGDESLVSIEEIKARYK